MSRSASIAAGLAIALAVSSGCAPQAGSTKAPPGPAEHSLSGLAAQHVAVLPTYTVRVMPGLDWTSSVGRLDDVKKALDADIVSAFDERGLKANWIFPDALERSYRSNSTYATDPSTLAEEPLRSPSLQSDARLPEPLATQLRTLVAFHEDVRLVLAPVELRLEPAGAVGRGRLRLVLVDARTSTVQWSGDISSDTASAFGPVITASIAARLAAIVAPQ